MNEVTDHAADLIDPNNKEIKALTDLARDAGQRQALDFVRDALAGGKVIQVGYCQKECEEVKTKIQALITALEFYASGKAWDANPLVKGEPIPEMEYGQTAQRALAFARSKNY